MILMDISMPDMDGIDATRLILEQYPQIKIIMLTSYPEDELIQESLGGYRDAILAVHDQTVQAMNAGKDVYTAMQEIELPAEFPSSEVYGKVPWSVRGIYEGYIGWFDGNVSNMYETPARSVYPDVVELAGGPEVLAARAVALVEQGDPQRALHMADIALAASMGAGDEG